MIIEIHQLELESLIEQRMASGAFRDVEDALIQALKIDPPPLQTDTSTSGQCTRKEGGILPLGQQLIEACASVAGIVDDVDLVRRPSSWRPLDMA